MTSALPESVAEIAEVIGEEKTLHLIGQLPQAGSRNWRVCIYVPKELKPDHRLVQILGPEDAEKLRYAFSGMILQPSNCRFLIRDLRNQRIRDMRDSGYSVADIAHGVDLSPYRVREILAKCS